MTSTESTTRPAIFGADRAAILAIVAALRATLNSVDVAWHHDPAACDGSGECVCPDLADPVREGLWEALRVALVRTVGDHAAAELLPEVGSDVPFDELLWRWASAASS